MGVNKLWVILDSCKKILPLHHLQNKRVCIDLSCWIVQLDHVNKSQCDIEDKLYLSEFFHHLGALIALNCSIILVTDGSIPSIKGSAFRSRFKRTKKPKKKAKKTNKKISTNKTSSIRRYMGSKFSCMIKEVKRLANALGIPCLDGVEEAEAQCAVLNSESLCDGCSTIDSDAFLFGARTVYRYICLDDQGYVVCYEMSDIERTLGFGRNSLIALGLLLGSDYSKGVHGVGPKSACSLVKSMGDSDVLQQLVSKGVPVKEPKVSKGMPVKEPKVSKGVPVKEPKVSKGVPVKKPKVSKRKGEILVQNDNNVSDLQSEAEFLKVINAYLKPKFHSPDSDAVRRVLGTYPFNHIQLQKYCSKFFNWSPKKTDELILPKIAERSLRRYANLRATSSKVGLELSISQIPVKCPISSIIEQRIHKGSDHFEVSWEDMHGLKSSAVPADLVQSACPEKITEFEKRRAQVKKTPMTEAELTFKEWLIEIY